MFFSNKKKKKTFSQKYILFTRLVYKKLFFCYLEIIFYQLNNVKNIRTFSYLLESLYILAFHLKYQKNKDYLSLFTFFIYLSDDVFQCVIMTWMISKKNRPILWKKITNISCNGQILLYTLYIYMVYMSPIKTCLHVVFLTKANSLIALFNVLTVNCNHVCRYGRYVLSVAKNSTFLYVIILSMQYK